MTRRLEDFVLAGSSVPRATFEHLASLDWIEAAENAVLVGPAGTGKSHVLLGLGEAAVVAGRRVRYLPVHTAAVAMLDRLLHHATTIVTRGDSCRMKEARARGGGLPTTA